jgi:uncharacterized protein
MKLITFLLLALSTLFAQIELGKVPTLLTLSGDDGGNVAGGDWKSNQNLGKLHIIIYADPDEKDEGEPFNDALDALKKAKGEDKFNTTAIINMAATWKPNFVINQLLKMKQDKYPKVTYVKDYKSVLVNKWNMENDAYDVLVLDASGSVLYHQKAPFNQSEIVKAMEIIEANF